MSYECNILNWSLTDLDTILWEVSLPLLQHLELKFKLDIALHHCISSFWRFCYWNKTPAEDKELDKPAYVFDVAPLDLLDLPGNSTDVFVCKL